LGEIEVLGPGERGKDRIRIKHRIMEIMGSWGSIKQKRGGKKVNGGCRGAKKAVAVDRTRGTAIKERVAVL